jgi:hypothetical protein
LEAKPTGMNLVNNGTVASVIDFSKVKPERTVRPRRSNPVPGQATEGLAQLCCSLGVDASDNMFQLQVRNHRAPKDSLLRTPFPPDSAGVVCSTNAAPPLAFVSSPCQRLLLSGLLPINE